MFDSKICILIVDDMEEVRETLKNYLQELGYTNTFEAADGECAWRTLTEGETRVDLVISDWNMPRCSGIDLLKRVRADKRFSKLAFMIVSGNYDQIHLSQAVSAGVNGYMAKPFGLPNIQHELEVVYSNTFNRSKVVG